MHVFGAVLGWHFLGKVAHLSQKSAHFGYPWPWRGGVEKPLFAHGEALIRPWAAKVAERELPSARNNPKGGQMVSK